MINVQLLKWIEKFLTVIILLKTAIKSSNTSANKVQIKFLKFKFLNFHIIYWKYKWVQSSFKNMLYLIVRVDFDSFRMVTYLSIIQFIFALSFIKKNYSVEYDKFCITK